MPKFSYIVKERTGSPAKTLKGFVEAVNEKQAAAILRRKELVPVEISPVKETLLKQIFLKFFNKISLTDVVNFTRNISTMISAGLPLTEALVILKNQSSAKMAQVIDDALTSVEGGLSLADSLGRHPEVFSKVYIALVKSGESAGVLDQVLKRLADNLEKEKEFKSRIKGAMIYPVIIVSGMSGVALIMMVFVVPKLTSLYKEFGAKLPVPTQVLMSVSSFMASNFLILILLAVGGFYFLQLFQKTAVGKRKIDSLKLKIPLWGNLQKQIEMTEISRTLGLLVGAGVQIVDGLNIVSSASDNVIFEEGIRKAAKQVEKGFPLASALAADENFPPIMSQLLSVGEETGKVDEVLEKISHFFETESDQTIKGLTTAIEPLIMVLLGVGVGFLIIAIILPIYNLTSQF